MQIVFRNLSPAGPAEAQPGEIYLIPAAAAERQRRDLASFVFQHGVSGLLGGSGAPERLVLDAEPKLDDMLAAALVQRCLLGSPLSTGVEPFGRYTAQLRDGQRPTPFPLEQSLEGIFLAMRSRADKPLTDPDTARQFCADWTRLARVILDAADRQEDPFTTPFFAGGAPGERTCSLRSINWGHGGGRTTSASEVDFSRELAFLAKDLDVYRQDFTQGETWHVRLPGSSTTGAGLLLNQPKSLLFKYWTRSPCLPPMEGPYQFVAVNWGNGKWALSSNAGPKLSLKPLADLLQAAERKQTQGRSAQDPWFDGKPHYTLVTSPRNGSQLPGAEVLRLTRKWCRGRLRGGRRLRRAAAVLAGCLAIAAALFLVLGKTASRQDSSQPLDLHDLHVLSVGVSKFQNLAEAYELPNAASDARHLAKTFKNLKGGLFKEVSTRVLTNEEATREEIINTGLQSWLLRQQALTSHSLVLITVSGHGFIEDHTNRYHFAPYDYDLTKQGTSGIFWEDLQRYLKSLPCPVVLFLDTCHSGAVNDTSAADPGSPRNPLKSIQKSVSDFSYNNGLVVMAACAGYQKANDTKRWGHGALTLALLEGIEGKYRYPAKNLYRTPLPRPARMGIVTLKDLDKYVTDRVEILSSEITAYQHRGQAAKTYATGNITLEQIPITMYKEE